MADDILVATFEDVLDNEARVNVTWDGQNGDLAQPVPYDAADGDIRAWVTEAVRNGSVPGIAEDAAAHFGDFVVERFGPTENRPYNAIFVRPKTPFG